MAEFLLRFGATRPSIRVPLFNGDGSVLSLASLVSATLRVQLSPGSLNPEVSQFHSLEGSIFERAMTVPVDGQVHYDWVPGDFSSDPALVIGKHRMTYRIVLGTSSVVLIFPRGGYDVLSIDADPVEAP